MPLVNECQFRAVNGGLDDFVVASAITGFFTPEQCTDPPIVDGGTYHWRAESDDFTQHELFEGTYTTATDTVARTTILQSSNGGAKVNFSAAPRVRQAVIDQDIPDASAGRELVNVSRDYYVNGGTGNDANDGLTALTPFATIQFAVDVVTKNLSIGPNCTAININVADGVYDEFVQIGQSDGFPTGYYGFAIYGESAAGTIIRPTGAVPAGAFAALTVIGATVWNIQNLDLDGTAADGDAILALGVYEGAQVFQFGTVRYGSDQTFATIDVEFATFYSSDSTLEFYGANTDRILYNLFGEVALYNNTFSFPGAPAITTFLAGEGTAGFDIFAAAFSGSATFTNQLLAIGTVYVHDTGGLTVTEITLNPSSSYNGAYGVRQKAGAVVAADLPPGSSQVIEDTSGLTVALYANIGGVLKSVALT